jgi:hypothetical protein
MSLEIAVAETFIRCLEQSQCYAEPYRHWLLSDALPERAARAIAELPWNPPSRRETYGKRETGNDHRSYFSPDQRQRHPVCDKVALAFQSPAVVAAIARTCAARLDGSFLRIEYCQDTAGFWLEPHTDIGAKRFTMLLYLSEGPGSESWGTDVLDANKVLVRRAPYGFNKGVIFIPADDTWHAFAERPIDGVRKSIIINYVGPEWRSRHELAFPEAPVA